MWLVPVSKVLEALKMDSDTDIDNVIKQGLHAATGVVSSILRTDFDKKTGFKEKFFVPEYADGSVGLLLSRGFVSDLTEVEILDFPYSTSGTSVLTTSVVALERGTVRVYPSYTPPYYLQVTYDCGFSVDPTTATLFKQSEVPEWLQSAAVLAAVIHMDAMHPTLRHDRKDPREIPEMKKEMYGLLQSHIRYEPMMLNPMR
jgi:hypothetical protein